MNNILDIESLYFKYDVDYIIKDVNFKVNNGDFVAILGENGSGKSTLLKLILGNLKAEKGVIKLFDDLIEKNNHYKDISYISQNSVLNYRNFPTTVEELIKNHLKFLKKNEDVNKYLKLINLEEHSKKSLSELSGGQLQRVGLALSLIKEAKIILLDEPTTGIDRLFINELFVLLKELSKQGKTIIMVTHEIEEALNYVDYVVYLKYGTTTRYSSEEFKKMMRISNV